MGSESYQHTIGYSCILFMMAQKEMQSLVGVVTTQQNLKFYIFIDREKLCFRGHRNLKVCNQFCKIT